MTNKPIRCFIALDLPFDAQIQLENIQQYLQKNGAKARWTRSQNIHMTLRFLGDRPPKWVEEIADALPQILYPTGIINITIDQFSAFPDISKPRVLWAGISDRAKKISAVFETINNGLAKLGIPKDREEFIPHLTLARCKTPAESIATATAIQRASIDPIKAPLTHLTFYQSTLGADGPAYKPIRTLPL